MAKEYKLDAKIGKIAKKQDPYKAKVQDLERRNSIDQKKLDKLAKKIDKIGTPNEKMMAKARNMLERNANKHLDASLKFADMHAKTGDKKYAEKSSKYADMHEEERRQMKDVEYALARKRRS